MDQGGTFTDVLRVDAAGRVRLDKVLSDRADLAALGADAVEVRRGTTVATNALLERAGAPVLLLISAGFGDLPILGDLRRPDLFRLDLARPPSLATRVVEVRGRIDAQGRVIERHELDPALLAEARGAGLRAAAIALVHGPLAPDEERRLGDLCRAAGFEHVSLGHEIAPSRGFLARLHTTLADAALSPLLPRAPGLYMRSDGGLAEAGGWRGCDAVLSGPAGGVIATAALARWAGLSAALGLDMGGTSTDVCRVTGEPERVDRLHIDGLTLRVPAVRLETVAAGGGSRLSVRDGVYAVGPESAGAHPGPACYGRGGPATITDCEAVLGRLPGFPAVCGPERDQPLDLDAARAALAALDPTRAPEEIALGFKAVAVEVMAGAVERLAIHMGVDPAAHALVAFGGAGPGHALAVARRLGVRTVLVPALAGAWSAVGVGLATRRAELVAPITTTIAQAADRALAGLPFAGRISARLALRHTGTAELIELPLPQPAPEVGPAGPLPEALIQAFHQEHRRRLGFHRPSAPIEAVEVRVAVEEPEVEPPTLAPRDEASVRGQVRACFDGWREVPLRGFAEAHGLVGPALVVGRGTTLVVEPGWQVAIDGDPAEAGWLRLTDLGAPRPRLGLDRHPVHTALLGARLTAIAEQMGAALSRLARSVSIRERADFSCAIFDAEGRLVVNAPHIPVHLGAMGATVRDLVQARGAALAPGQVWVSNDPYAGGSHLPDITAITPIFRDGPRPVAFVGCRGHHADVGGVTPGSMPPDSTTLDQEGLVLRQTLLVDQGRLQPVALPGCREPDTVLADLEAQAAANAWGASALHALIDEMGAEVLAAQLEHLQQTAAEATAALLARVPDGVFQAEERLDDGLVLTVTVEIQGERARISLGGPPHPGNLNTPRAVAVASLLYALRTLVGRPLPLGEGALRPIELEIEPGGLFDPQPPRAVVGGNVETSQRLVDALLRALGACAAGQGTMNNLTVGTPAGAWYETIGGGGGAGPGFDGPGGVQIHMTNTRATDVEELEARFPVRLERLALRRGSGGAGQRRGGDGVEKQWIFLAPCEVSMLAGRRVAGAPGLAGGGDGAPGQDERDLGQGWEPAPRRWRARPGDRLRVRTPGGGGYGPCD